MFLNEKRRNPDSRFYPFLSRESFMALSSSWSCVTSSIHIEGCQCVSLNCCYQSWKQIWGGEIVSESPVSQTSVHQCVCGKNGNIFLFLYHCICSYEQACCQIQRFGWSDQFIRIQNIWRVKLGLTKINSANSSNKNTRLVWTAALAIGSPKVFLTHKMFTRTSYVRMSGVKRHQI